ncbi:PucR family transcriptional regulator [Streptomyces sp. NPDC050560]|uniref:PucR family transcriptional regulator n=1 Tax=Streptomyces sp. NPDC050560 TaxID=3365630 RepID=UPI003788E273
MRLRALLDNDALGLGLLGGEDELDRTVRGVMTTDLRDPSRYLSGGELVLTGLAWRRGPEDSEPFVRLLATAQVTALAVGDAELDRVPEDVVAACARHRLPLFSVDASVAFATVTEHVVRQVSGERAGDLATVVERHRRLMAPGHAGEGPDAVLGLLGSDLDLRAWVLSPTGRRIAGDLGDGGAAGGRALGADTAARLAAGALAAARGGRRGPHRIEVGPTVYSVFEVAPADDGTGGAGDAGVADAQGSRLTGWLLAVEADAGEWPPERLDLLRGVTGLVAVERDRRDAARSVRRRMARDVLTMVAEGAPAAEIAARLRVAAPVLGPGLGGTPRWQLVVAAVEWDGAPDAATAQTVLEEALVEPGPRRPARTAVARTGDEAVALLPLPPDEEAGVDAEALVRRVAGPLGAGLGDDGRFTLGLSAPVQSAQALRGALEEARHARRVAAARPGAVSAAGHRELASHVLLLPFVPEDVRRAFTARLLDPLRAYDERHRAELVPTLKAFLDCDGSWTRCAGRLHLHVNTLRYRVGRIEQLTGRDLSRLEDKLDFFLALRMG